MCVLFLGLLAQLRTITSLHHLDHFLIAIILFGIIVQHFRQSYNVHIAQIIAIHTLSWKKLIVIPLKI
jgi:hypothetical protein